MNTQTCFKEFFGMKNSFTLLLGLLLATTLSAQQLPNMNFDNWHKTRGSWNLYAEKDEDNRVWDTANRGSSILGINGTTPEYEHVAVAGEGKAAARIASKKILGKLLAGNLFTGKFVRIVKMKGAELEFGTPFNGRPKSLSGFAHYQPGSIHVVKAPYKNLKGTGDEAIIEVTLAAWDAPQRVDTTEKTLDRDESDPDIVATGHLILDKETDGYIPFEIPLEYRDDRTPNYIIILCTSSRFGNYFTGSSDSVLFVDEFQFNY